MNGGSKMSILGEVTAVGLLVLGGILVLLDGAPLLEILVVGVIVLCGLGQWWELRKLSEETRLVGNRLLFLVGVTLVSLASF
jgi:hypothetical protein